VAPRDPEATKERILAAALHEFSDKGISGARVDAIAARAKVNKRMLYYYFGSKDGLFREILRRRLVERSAVLRSSGMAGVERLAARQVRLLGESEYVRLLMWEALETTPGRPANEEIRRDFYTTWIDVVKEEQAAGNFPSDLDPAQLVLSEVLLILGPVAFPQLTRLVTGHALTDPEFVARRSEFLEHLEQRIEAPLPVRN
jgi:TetR/AcrR family transcriptional regulator